MKTLSTVLFGLFLAAILAVPAAAQFNRDYFYPSLTHVNRFSTDVSVRLADETFVTVGTQFGPNLDRDAVITRVDAAGSVIWSRTYGDPNVDEEALGVTVSHDGEDVLVTGSARGDLWILRVNVAAGNVVWSRTYGGNPREVGHVILPFTDGLGAHYFAVGMIFAGPSRRLYVVRIDETGAPVYRLRYDAGISAFDQPTAVLARQDEIWITGLHRQLNIPLSLFVFRIRASTGLNLPMSFYPHPDGSSADRLPELAPAFGQGVLAAYTVRSAGEPWIAALELDGNLDPVWERLYQGTGPLLPPGPMQEASWGLGVERESNGYTIGTAHTDRSLAGLLFIDAVGNPLSLFHYQDFGFTGPGVGPGDSVARMEADERGYLLKNHLMNGFSLTRTDLAGNAPCQVEPKIVDVDAKVERRDLPYTPTAWGVNNPYPIDPRDLELEAADCN